MLHSASALDVGLAPRAPSSEGATGGLLSMLVGATKSPVHDSLV